MLSHSVGAVIDTLVPDPDWKWVRFSTPTVVPAELFSDRSKEIWNGSLVTLPVSLERIGIRLFSAQPLRLPGSQPLSQPPALPVHGGFDWPWSVVAASVNVVSAVLTPSVAVVVYCAMKLLGSSKRYENPPLTWVMAVPVHAQ